MNALILTLALAAPGSLGDALRAAGAFDDGVDDRLDVTRRAAPLGPKIMWGLGLLATGAGLVGWATSGGCAVEARGGGCVEVEGTPGVYPSLIVLGLGATITGNFWSSLEDR